MTSTQLTEETRPPSDRTQNSLNLSNHLGGSRLLECPLQVLHLKHVSQTHKPNFIFFLASDVTHDAAQKGQHSATIQPKALQSETNERWRVGRTSNQKNAFPTSYRGYPYGFAKAHAAFLTLSPSIPVFDGSKKFEEIQEPGLRRGKSHTSKRNQFRLSNKVRKHECQKFCYSVHLLTCANPQGAQQYTKSRLWAWGECVGRVGKNNGARRREKNHKVGMQSRKYTHVYKIQWPLDTLSTHTKPKTEIRNG